MNTKLVVSFLLGMMSVSLISCVSATKYGERNSFYGNSIKEDSKTQGLYYSTFNGNASTSSWSSKGYSELGALEFCANKSKYALMSQAVNQSVSSTTLNAYSNSYTVNRNTYTNYNIIPVTTTYPSYTTLFQCKTKFLTLDGVTETEPISREMVHAITKDFKAGIMLKDISANSKNTPFKLDDIIIKVNGIRIEGLTEISDALDKAALKSVPVTIIRESQIKTVTVDVQDNTAIIKAFNQKAASGICTPTATQTAAQNKGPTMAGKSNSDPAADNTEVDSFKIACALVTDFLN